MPSDSIKAHGFLAAGLLCVGLVVTAAAQQGAEPFFPVAVTYDPGTKSAEEILDELRVLRGSGFNAISIVERRLKTQDTDTLAQLAAKADLKVRPRMGVEDSAPRKAAPTGPELRLWAWVEMARGASSITFDEPSETAAAFARVVTRNSALFVTLRPRAAVSDVRIDGDDGAIKVDFLESRDVIMMIGLNVSDRTHRVTMTFAPDTQEAIWQNMETGASVNFVAGPNGPTYTYRFAPHDVFVLMIRRAIR